MTTESNNMHRHVVDTGIGATGLALAVVFPSLAQVNEWISTVGGTLSMIVGAYGVYRIFTHKNK